MEVKDIVENIDIEKRIEFFNEALNFIKIGEDSKEILISGLVNCYCEKGDELKALGLIDDFLRENPNNSNATSTKSDIYIQRKKPDYETAIKIIKEALEKKMFDDEYILLSKLALLYERYGKKEEAKQYQKLARKKYDETLPF